ncbi:hypothetical protein F383_36497 [Gossypium arboreum]|uniref:Uncharacterized protein n=1 Tax=Gossypium arboreum TaxID=29729 RepID=A0A0B0Q011_GOSAR|nr:hypothetical protein F383_36497 [Gossypium arboreum]
MYRTTSCLLDTL